MQTIFRYVLFLFLLPFFMGCEESNVLIDNAGEDKLTVLIDAVTYTLPPKSHYRAFVEPGIHTFSVKDAEGKALDEGSFQLENGGLFNAAKAEYLIWSEWFGDMARKDSVLKQEWIKVEEMEIFGEFERIAGESLYVEQRWDFSVDEEMPESVRAWELTDKRWVVKKKLFRLEDAMLHYQSVSAPTE